MGIYVDSYKYQRAVFGSCWTTMSRKDVLPSSFAIHPGYYYGMNITSELPFQIYQVYSIEPHFSLLLPWRKIKLRNSDHLGNHLPCPFSCHKDFFLDLRSQANAM